MVTTTEDTFDVFRFFFSWTLLGEMTAGASDAAEAALAVDLGMSIPLALWCVSFWSGKFKFYFGVI